MRAVRFHAFGDPEVLRVDEVPEPGPPTGDQLLVRVGASSVNGTDLGLRRGDLKIATWGRMPFVPGFDVAGEVLACGPAVTAFRPGDRVMALLSHGGGGQCEQVLLRQHRAARAPASVSDTEAAALPLAGLTALQALYGHGALAARRRPRVLVNGASGGIGGFGVQLASRAGAHVTAVVAGARRAHVTELGADDVVDRDREDVVTVGGRWDLVLDAAGTLSFASIRPSVSDGGAVVSTRPISADALRSLVRAGRGRVGRGGTDRDSVRFAVVRTSPRSQDLARLAAEVDAGRLRPMVDRAYPVDRVVDAHRHAEGGVRGKVVVELGP